LFETPLNKDWGSYGFEKGQAVCNAADVTYAVGGTSCLGDCEYGVDDTELRQYLSCDLVEDISQGRQGYEFVQCDCHCDAMSPVEKPSYMAMLLSYVAQSLVVSVVGVNMGFRKQNIELWKKMLKKRRTTVTTVKGAGGGSDASESCPYRDSDMSSVSCD
jgi:hypothetical protein